MTPLSTTPPPKPPPALTWPPGLRTLIRHYREDLRRRGLPPSTASLVQRTLGYFVLFLVWRERNQIDRIRAEDARDFNVWLQERLAEPPIPEVREPRETMARLGLRIVRGFTRWLVATGRLSVDPLAVLRERTGNEVGSDPARSTEIRPDPRRRGGGPDRKFRRPTTPKIPKTPKTQQ